MRNCIVNVIAICVDGSVAVLNGRLLQYMRRVCWTDESGDSVEDLKGLTEWAAVPVSFVFIFDDGSAFAVSSSELFGMFDGDIDYMDDVFEKAFFSLVKQLNDPHGFCFKGIML